MITIPEKKTETIGVRLPKSLLEKLDLYVKTYNKEICQPRNLYTDRSKVVRAIIVLFLMSKGLIGYEYNEYADPCNVEYAKD